jgi:hypothetical protein
MNIWEQLKSPPGQYRPIPLWSWNDKLETAELHRQLEEMHKAGIGGFFMHARGGLQTPYLGEEWMEAIRACIEKSRELGMSPWLYDENGWPSGFADGRVPAKGMAYQQKSLAYELAPFGQEDKRTIAWYAKRGGGYKLLPDDCAGEGADLRLYYSVNPHYIDTLSVQAVRAFLDSTHEEYWGRFGAEFGSELKGIFTDEPQFARGQLPWSFELEDTFRGKYGYELKEALPGLFFDQEDSSRSRYAFWDTVTTMFVTAYAKQIGDWCGERGWSSVGHVVDEQELTNQVTSVGDPMAFYEHLQIPGCDWLGRFTGEEPVVPKQVSSAARQLGRRQAITESFGCSGWNASFRDLKRITEWQYVHGINLLCPHLESYSLRGLRKRDYPPSLFYQQPWWEDYKSFNDYAARLSMLLSNGTRQAQVLLLHPVRSAWVNQRGTDKSAIAPYHESFAQLSRWMCQAFLEHDYGSESLIEGHGRVDEGSFIIGEAAYRAVVIPPGITLGGRTLELLKEFAAQGGRVVAFAPYPFLINGVISVELERFMKGVLRPGWGQKELLASLVGAAEPFISLKDEHGTLLRSDSLNVQTLELDGASLYFIVNSGEEEYPSVQIDLYRRGQVQLLDLITGDSIPLLQEETACGVRVRLPVYPSGSLMLRLNPDGHSWQEQDAAWSPAVSSPGVQPVLDGGSPTVRSEDNPADRLIDLEIDRRTARPIHPEIARQTDRLADNTDGRAGDLDITLQQDWTVTRMDLNSLTLDTGRFRVEDEEWSEIQPVIFMQEQLLAYGRPVRLELEFRFEVSFDVDKPRELYLVLEQPEKTSIELNGFPVKEGACGWWRDIAFRKIDISGKAVQGTNIIRLKSAFYNSPETYAAIERAKQFEAEGNKLTLDTELESIYLAGDFGVASQGAFTCGERRSIHTDGPFVLTEPLVTAGSRDLVSQGLPFFAGRLELEQTVHVEASDWNKARWVFTAPPDAVVSRLFINGHEVDPFFWEPYEADISLYLHQGDNVVRLELAGSCRNLLGPHHHIKGEVYKIGPDSFKDTPGWTDKDIGKGTCIYTDRYTFVQFGLQAGPVIRLYP